MLRHLGIGVVLASILASCQPSLRPKARPVVPPELLGEFKDDYGNSFRVSDSLFEQLPSTRYQVVDWNLAEQYLIARNDDRNSSDPGLWTRIDWMRFTGMSPYTWGFCLTAYRAPTADAARATEAANRSTPRTGCNGHPFSRMRRSG